MTSAPATAIRLPPAHRQTRIRVPVLSLLAAVLTGAAAVALAIGAFPVSLTDVLSGVDGGLQRAIFVDIRAPRVMQIGRASCRERV